jgi:hypothetical protein
LLPNFSFSLTFGDVVNVVSLNRAGRLFTHVTTPR